MCKKIKNCFEPAIRFEKLISAHKRARKHKGYKKEVLEFELNLENNIVNLMNHIRNGTYRLGEYRQFKVYEPKERVIEALPYIDRIVHQWYVEEFIKPYIVPKFIYQSYACLSNKGTHKAVEQVEKYLREMQSHNPNYWILKCDIKKFFYNINSKKLFQIMQKYFNDPAFLQFTKILIFSNRKNSQYVGIPIGNYTSQFYANIYLNELDQYIKRELKVKYYVRYMDDFILILNHKEDCITLKNKISQFLNRELFLELNEKSRYYPNKMGINFCGYRIFATHRLLRNSSKTKIKKKVKKWNQLYKQNILDIPLAMQSLHSWIGHSSHCNSYTLQQKVIDNCNFIYQEKNIPTMVYQDAILEDDTIE